MISSDPGNPFGLLPNQNSKLSKSAPGMCDEAEDTRHTWFSLGIGAQSSEWFECLHCGEWMVD